LGIIRQLRIGLTSTIINCLRRKESSGAGSPERTPFFQQLASLWRFQDGDQPQPVILKDHTTDLISSSTLLPSAVLLRMNHPDESVQDLFGVSAGLLQFLDSIPWELQITHEASLLAAERLRHMWQDFCLKSRTTMT
jgi:hypothetical protein